MNEEQIMTEKNYEKLYKEALERARMINDGKDVDIEAGTTICEYIFPQLKVSKDEKIRKALIERIIEIDLEESIKGSEFYAGDYDGYECITWLEKQGEVDITSYEEAENEKREFVGYGFLKCKGDFLSFKEGENYWLEYVGKDNYNVRSDNLLGQTFHIKPMELYTVFRPLLWTEKQDNQRPADKIEPKFKVGDWVVTSYGKVNQVIAIDEDGDGFTLDDDTYFSGSWKDNYHLWTIQDAKDGDVLISQSGNPLIYNGNYNSLYIGAYCGITCDDNKFKVAEEKCHWTENVDIKPATKEQHDLLFTKMKEAGYEFDFEKKDLKKIEKKHTEWSEEDEKMFRSLSNALARISSNTRTDSTSINYSFFAEIDWLKSLKDRVQPQHKEWSDDDKEMFKLCVDAIENYYTEEDENRIYKWLKSLKN